MRYAWLVSLSLLLCAPLTLAAEQKPVTPNIQHVIYITLDGTRWQDVFYQHPYLPKLWQKYAKLGVMYGGPNNSKTMEVASIPVSLPSYQSQMSGQVQPCDGNDCGRIRVATLPEQLVNQLGFKKQDVAVFASWDRIAYAAEHIPGTVYINAGNVPALDPLTAKPDNVMAEINKSQVGHQQPTGERKDIFTYAQAMHYLIKYQPKFMWISLGDSDEAAHAKQKVQYHQALAFYDYAIDHLFHTLKKLAIEDNTLVIITTDHGRGNGEHWTTHGPKYPESKQTWSFVYNGELKLPPHAKAGAHYSTLSIRPTVMAAFKS